MNDLPADVSATALKHGISIVEREEDFLATLDKLPGQEFEAATARSALASAMKAAGIEEEAPAGVPPQAKVNGKAPPTVADGLLDAPPTISEVVRAASTKPPKLPGLSSKTRSVVKDATPAPGRGKTVAEAVAESPKVDPEKQSEPEPKTKASGKKLPTLHPNHPDRVAAKVTDLAEVRKAKAAAKPVAQKPAPEAAKGKGVAKAAGKPAPKAAPAKAIGPDNGNGRPRGKRWAVKSLVIQNLTMPADQVLRALAEQNIESSIDSVTSIRLDFLATVRQAKIMGKLTDKVAKLVPEAKANSRNSSTVLAAINQIVIADPKLETKDVIDKLKANVSKEIRERAGTDVSASRAAIVESLTVLKEYKALKA